MARVNEAAIATYGNRLPFHLTPGQDDGSTKFQSGSKPLLQRRIIGVHLFELGQQDLHVLQLPAFLPVIDQQHPSLAIVGMSLNDFLQLFLRRFELLLTVQRGGQVVAVIAVIGLKFDGLGQAEQGEFALLVMQQPEPQGMLQVGGVGLCLQLPGQQLPGGVRSEERRVGKECRL